MFPGEKNTYRKLRGQIPADVYFPAILKWAKSEVQQRAFLLKKWRKNGEKNAKNIERSAGAFCLLHNRYQLIISQSLDWLFCVVKVLTTKGFAKERKFSKTLLELRSLGEGVSNSLFDGGQKGVLLPLVKSHNPLTFIAIQTPSIKTVFSLGWWGIFRYFATSDKSCKIQYFFQAALDNYSQRSILH